MPDLKRFVTIDDLHADLLRQHSRTCQFVPLEWSVRQRIAQLNWCVGGEAVVLVAARVPVDNGRL